MMFLFIAALCSPPCQFGGRCVRPNVCHCSPGFLAPYCRRKFLVKITFRACLFSRKYQLKPTCTTKYKAAHCEYIWLNDLFKHVIYFLRSQRLVTQPVLMVEFASDRINVAAPKATRETTACKVHWDGVVFI